MINILLKRFVDSLIFLGLVFSLFLVTPLIAQERLPLDNSLENYHPSPRYRESESHPLRIITYALHPIGWFAREFIFRPFSHFVSSDEKRASIFGYRDPHDIRRPLCYSKSSTVPDCKQLDVEHSSSYTPGHSTSGAPDKISIMDIE